MQGLNMKRILTIILVMTMGHAVAAEPEARFPANEIWSGSGEPMAFLSHYYTFLDNGRFVYTSIYSGGRYLEHTLHGTYAYDPSRGEIHLTLDDANGVGESGYPLKHMCPHMLEVVECGKKEITVKARETRLMISKSGDERTEKLLDSTTEQVLARKRLSNPLAMTVPHFASDIVAADVYAKPSFLKPSPDSKHMKLSDEEMCAVVRLFNSVPYAPSLRDYSSAEGAMLTLRFTCADRSEIYLTGYEDSRLILYICRNGGNHPFATSMARTLPSYIPAATGQAILASISEIVQKYLE